MLKNVANVSKISYVLNKYYTEKYFKYSYLFDVMYNQNNYTWFIAKIIPWCDMTH